MKKLFLSVLAMYVGILASFSQNSDSVYKKRSLTFEEVNIVSSYYSQNGNNSAVTGGIGTEKLSDISNSIDLRFSLYDKRGRKHSFSGEIGIDHYTSASSDKINPSTISSASSADTRIYPSIEWIMENENRGTTFGAGLSLSQEYDYQSIGASINFAQKTKNRMGEFSAKLNGFLDKVSLIYPVELRNSGGSGQDDDDDDDDHGTAARNSLSGGLGWSQIINKNFQIKFDAEMVYQQGYLGLPFHRVYFNDQSVHVENLPSTRLKIPLGFRANYFFGDKILLRTWFRHYYDDWGITSNAVQMETVLKITPFISFTPFYRYYTQSAVSYFSPYLMHKTGDVYYTSNFDLSNFNSNFFGAGFRIASPKGVFKIKHFNALELRYGHYEKTNGMNSNIISMSIKVK